MIRLCLVAFSAGWLCAGCASDSDDAPDVGETVGLLTDPLSMPAQPTLDPARFHSAKDCAGCHPQHVEQWSGSPHAYAMVDPVFRALVRVRHEDFGGREDAFCTQCHSAIGTRGGECVDGFDFASLSPIVLEGVTCEACHRISETVRPFNAGHVLDPEAPMAGGIADPVENGFHASRFDPLFSQSDLCSTCHDVVEVRGVKLERPFEEWTQSPAAAEGRHCQSCHLPAEPGRASPLGPEREVHDHHFFSVALPLLPGFLDEAEEQKRTEAAVALLRGAASLDVKAPSSVTAGQQADVLVTITNRIDGHNLPTGTTFLRQMWLELVATDAEGRVVYRTGHLDEAGDLRDVWSEHDPFGDPDLIRLGSELIDADGDPTPFPWRAAEHVLRTLPPLHERTYTLFVPVPPDAASPITIEARLRFRGTPPWLLRFLDLEHLQTRNAVRDMAEADASIEVL